MLVAYDYFRRFYDGKSNKNESDKDKLSNERKSDITDNKICDLDKNIIIGGTDYGKYITCTGIKVIYTYDPVDCKTNDLLPFSSKDGFETFMKHPLYDNFEYIVIADSYVKELPNISKLPKSLQYIEFDHCAISCKLNLLTKYIDNGLWMEYGYKKLCFRDNESYLADNDGKLIDIRNSYSIHEYDGPMEYLRLRTKMLKRKVDIISNWFLDCKYDPKYKYCRDRLEKEHEEIYSS